MRIKKHPGSYYYRHGLKTNQSLNQTQCHQIFQQEFERQKQLIKRNPKAILVYYSYVPATNPDTNKKLYLFLGCRSHAIVEAASGIVIAQVTFLNNIFDENAARKLFKNLKRLY